RKRLAIARALVADPALLLLDGPFEGLDGRARAELRAVLAELASLGKTLLVTAGTLDDLVELCSEAGFLDSGRLVASGPTRDPLRATEPADVAGLSAGH